MSLQNRLTDLTTRIANEVKALRTLLNGNAADLSALTITAKSNLVAALNELKADVDAAAQSGGAAGVHGGYEPALRRVAPLRPGL